MENNEKLTQLAELWGESVMELLTHASGDSLVPAICTNPGCEFATETEPDQREGWCEECHTNTVCSSLVLAGVT